MAAAAGPLRTCSSSSVHSTRATAGSGGVVFIRPDDIVDVGAARAVQPASRRPVPGRRQQQRRHHPQRAAGPAGVVRGGPGDVGGDVLLELACQDGHNPPAEPAAGRGDVFTAGRGLPRETGAPQPHGAGPGPGFQPSQPVADHRRRGRRIQGHHRGKRKHVRVPEHVARVPGAGQAPRADGQLTT